VKLQTIRPAALTLVVVAVTTLAACEKKAATNDSSAAAASAAAAAPAAPAAPAMAGVAIVSPKEGDSTGADVTVVLSKEGPVTIESLASATGTSARSIFRYFKNTHGCTPMEFAKRVRLRRAREMLLSGEPGTSVTGIAFACGFQNLGHFARDYRGLHDDGSEWAICASWTRQGDKVRLFWAAEGDFETADPGFDPHLAPDPTPLWNILDWTPGGRGRDWYPKLEYNA